MIDDAELLRHYVEARSGEAFGQLVERHLGMVYNSANRQLGEYSHLSHDVAQTVFILLAEKAPSLLRHTSLVGWLYTTTRYKVSKVLEAERRRRAREQVVVAMQAGQDEPESRDEWERIRPVLDQALLGLGETDRMALLLRFFEGQGFSEIGAHLLLSEKAASRRVARALEKLRTRLSRRGITSSTAALAATLGAHAGTLAPTGLAGTVASSAFAAAGAKAAAYSGKLGLAGMLGSGNSAAGLAGILGIAAAVGGTTGWITIREAEADRSVQLQLADARREVDAQTAQLAQLRDENQRAEGAITTLLASASAGAGRAGEPASGPLAEGRRFLDSFPQARSLFMQLNKCAIDQRYGPYFRLANLSPRQIRQFEDLLAADWLSALALTPARMGLGPVADATIAQINQAVGPQAAGTLQAYRDNLLTSYYLTDSAMAAAGLAGVPLSARQTDLLAQTIAANSSRSLPGADGVSYKYLVAAAVNWDAVLEYARSALSPAQFDAVQGAFLRTQLEASEALALADTTKVAAKPQ